MTTKATVVRLLSNNRPLKIFFSLLSIPWEKNVKPKMISLRNVTIFFATQMTDPCVRCPSIRRVAFHRNWFLRHFVVTFNWKKKYWLATMNIKIRLIFFAGKFNKFLIYFSHDILSCSKQGFLTCFLVVNPKNDKTSTANQKNTLYTLCKCSWNGCKTGHPPRGLRSYKICIRI